MNPAFPFAELDVRKYMANFQVPGFEYEALVEAQKRNIATFQEAGTIASRNFQAIAQRQVEMVQRGLEAAFSGANDVAKAKSPEDSLKCQAALAQRAFEAQVANLREIGQMAQKAGGEVFEVVNKRFLEGLDEIVATAAKAESDFEAATPKVTKPKAK